MTVKEYLLKVRNQDILLKTIESEREELKSVMAMHAVELSERVSGGNKQSDLSGIIIKLQQYTEEVNAEWDKLIDMRKKAKAMIKKLENPVYEALLFARYINGSSWEQISVNMNYNYRWTLKLHGKALAELENKIDELKEDTQRHMKT